MAASYRSAKTEIRPSAIEGQGLFARRAFRKDEIVAIKGGHILNHRQLRRVKGRIADSYLQIADGFFIGAASAAEVKGNKLFINHSCSPNVGILGQIIFVAIRPIRAGEELTYDWAMEENAPARTRCRCGAPNCRGLLTGRDWRNPVLRRKYRRYLSAYLAAKRLGRQTRRRGSAARRRGARPSAAGRRGQMRSRVARRDLPK